MHLGYSPSASSRNKLSTTKSRCFSQKGSRPKLDFSKEAHKYLVWLEILYLLKEKSKRESIRLRSKKDRAKICVTPLIYRSYRDLRPTNMFGHEINLVLPHRSHLCKIINF